MNTAAQSLPWPLRERALHALRALRHHFTTLVYGMAMIILVFIAVLSYWSVNSALDRAESVAQTRQAQVELEELTSLCSSARIAWRSFLISGSSRHAEEYEAAAKLIPSKIQSLKSLTSDNLRQQQRLLSLFSTIDRDLSVMAESIKQKAGGNLTKPAEVVTQLRSDNSGVADFTILAGKMKEEEKYLLSLREAESDASNERVVRVIMIGNISSFLILLLSFGLFRREIQQRKFVEQSLRKTEERFRSIAQSANDAVLSTDGQGSIVFWNRAAQKIFGYSDEEILGKPLIRLMPEPYPEAHLSDGLFATTELPTTGKTIELSARRKNGMEFPIEISLAKWQSHGETFFSAIIRDITDRKRVEDDLRREEERFRLMVESITDYAIFMLDPSGHIVSWNAGAERINGYRTEEILGQHFSLFYPREDLVRSKPQNELAVATERGRSEDEGWRVRKDGSAFWATVIINALRDASGALRGFVKVTRDLTERKLANARVRESEAWLQAFMNNSPSIMFIKDLQGRYLHVNDQFMRAFGLEKANIISYTDEEIFPPHMVAVYQANDAGVIASDTVIEREEIMPHADGMHTSIVCKFPIHDSSGRITALGGIATDITMRKKVEEKFRGLLESAPDAMVIVDKDGKIVLVNTQAEKCFGYQREALLGKPVEVLIPERYIAQHPQNRSGFFMAPRARPMGNNAELWGRHSNGGEFPIEISLSPLQTETGMLVTAAIRDISERKVAEWQIDILHANLEEHAEQLQTANQSLQDYTKQLEATNKELEGFTYTVAHDLRTPLRAIIGFSRMVEEGHQDKLDADGMRLLKVIRDNSVRMSELIEDLLSFSKLGRQPLRTAEIDISALVKSVLDELQGEIGGRSIKFDVKALSPAQGDGILIRQVWSNLLSNAIKFTSHTEHPMIEVGETKVNAENVYYVKDNGVGFDMRYYDKLFGVFHRLHDADEYPGTGVGLAIVHKVITRHGGRVWAESKVNEGATFCFVLPEMRSTDLKE